MNQSLSRIWIIIIVVVFLAGGFFVWQYFGASEEKTTKWREYKFEEVSQDFKSPDFYDRRLIGIQESGQRDVIVLSMKELMNWEETGFYPREVSFPVYSSKIFFVKHQAETAHSAGFFILNVITLKTKELTEVGPIYENYYNYLSLVSPDGFKIASYGNSDLYLLDLFQDKAILLAKTQPGETFYLAAEAPEFQWLDDDTIQYPVHSVQDIYAPPIEIRKISIKTREVEKVVKDETANWQIYRNEKYGFEIKYPLDWQLDLRGVSTLISLDVEKNNFLTEEEFKTRWGPYYDMRFVDDIKITVYASLNELPDNKEGLSLGEWIEKRMGEYLIAKNSKKEITINKYQGIEVEELGMTSYRSIFLVRDPLIYEFSLEMARPLEEMNLFNQMLSTFKFLEGDVIVPVRKSAKDVKVMTYMMQIGAAAEIYYGENSNYLNLASDEEVWNLKKQIQNEIGKWPGMITSNDAYCVDVTLSDGKTKYCIDSEGRRGENLGCSSTQLICISY